MIVNVTKRDIDEGIPESGESCPIALAVTRELVNLDIHEYISVEAKYLVIDEDWYFNSFKFPKKCRRFIADFDDELSVEPFSFNLPKKYYEKFKNTRTGVNSTNKRIRK